MNVVDGLFFALLALADLALIVQLRRARSRRMRKERVMRSLVLAVQRENAATPAAPPRRWAALRRAS